MTSPTADSEGSERRDQYDRDDETASARLDRNWNELLQELRVTQTGVQLLTGFLLAMPLQSRFRDLNEFEVAVYLCALSFGVLATGFLVAPVSLHRMVFRKHMKETIVHTADRLAKVGLALLALTVIAVTVLIFTVVIEWIAGVAVGIVAAVVFLTLWTVLPLRLRARVSS